MNFSDAPEQRAIIIRKEDNMFTALSQSIDKLESWHIFALLSLAAFLVAIVAAYINTRKPK